MRKKLEDETNRRTKEQNNHHVVSERITNLEKEKRDLADRLKKENENMEKLKKANAELSIAKTASGEVVFRIVLEIFCGQIKCLLLTVFHRK